MLYFFDEYALDTERRELRGGGPESPSVEPKVFDLLVYLIEGRDRVVSKDDLIAGVWMGRAVSDSALTSCINAARVTVGDNGQEQRLIRTLPRKGVPIRRHCAGGEQPGRADATERRACVGEARESLFRASRRWPFCRSRISATTVSSSISLMASPRTSSHALRGSSGSSYPLATRRSHTGERGQRKSDRSRARSALCAGRQRQAFRTASADRRGVERDVDRPASLDRAI